MKANVSDGTEHLLEGKLRQQGIVGKGIAFDEKSKQFVAEVDASEDQLDRLLDAGCTVEPLPDDPASGGTEKVDAKLAFGIKAAQDQAVVDPVLAREQAAPAIAKATRKARKKQAKRGPKPKGVPERRYSVTLEKTSHDLILQVQDRMQRNSDVALASMGLPKTSRVTLADSVGACARLWLERNPAQDEGQASAA